MILPPQFLNSIKDAKGFEEKSFIEVHEKEEKITSIRLNPFKKTNLIFELNEKVQWCEDGFFLKERPSFTFDPLFHAGCYYVQEAGSMFLELAIKHSVNLSETLTVLDLCAAPGGKSTLVNSLISTESLLISNEVIKQRADILAYNLSKWGSCNTAVTNCDPSVYAKLPGVFDLIIADVPCSGSGLFRKQPDAVKEWSIDNVNLCSTRQKRIIADSIASLKENGVLIYSTCSYSTEEDEALVSWIIKEFGMEFIKLPINNEWGIIETEFGYRFYPNLAKSEGFFCAALRKKSEQETAGFKTKKTNFCSLNKKDLVYFEDKIRLNDNLVVFKFQNDYKLVNTELFRFLNSFGQNLYLKKTGVTIGELKQKDFLPHHELALSNHLHNNTPRIELTKEQALQFLRKENIHLNAAKGIHLMSYQNQGLGWAKILDNRINNYLPKEFRILNSGDND